MTTVQWLTLIFGMVAAFSLGFISGRQAGVRSVADLIKSMSDLTSSLASANSDSRNKQD